MQHLSLTIQKANLTAITIDLKCEHGTKEWMEYQAVLRDPSAYLGSHASHSRSQVSASLRIHFLHNESSLGKVPCKHHIGGYEVLEDGCVCGLGKP